MSAGGQSASWKRPVAETFFYDLVCPSWIVLAKVLRGNHKNNETDQRTISQLALTQLGVGSQLQGSVLISSETQRPGRTGEKRVAGKVGRVFWGRCETMCGEPRGGGGEGRTWHVEERMKILWLGLECQVGRQARDDAPWRTLHPNT